MDEEASLPLASRMIFSSLRAIPVGFRKMFFTALLLAYYYIAPIRRNVALENLQLAFPDKDPGELSKIAKGVYRNMAIVAAEFFDLPSWTRETISRIVAVEGLEHCIAALKKKRGLLLFGAHFGNWELAAAAIPLLLKPVVVIYRPLDNAILEHLVTWVRQTTGNAVMAKDSAMWPMLRVLRKNGILGLLVDQNTGEWEGVFVDFFGRPACTTNGPALLALHTGAPVVPVFMVRQDDGRYRIIFSPAVDIIHTEDRENDVIENTRNFTAIIEKMVRRYPDQWLWVHQRWKEKKIGEEAGG
ncbi:MAG: lysophospholipid acyltransferase family protein [Deltaproteobacteria bacterium]|nr:lysophospholipid acyltransferase family protein [Deltaproteobacteria bacterium]